MTTTVDRTDLGSRLQLALGARSAPRATRRWQQKLWICVAAFVLACDAGGITDAECDRCNELRIRTDREEYRPGSVVRFTMSNRSATALVYDWCSVALASRTSNDRPFETVYMPSRRCGRDATLSDVIANMQTIEPGESVQDSVVITVAYQGQQRVHVWLISDDGIPEDGNPVASNTFDVYPGASTSLTGGRS